MSCYILDRLNSLASEPKPAIGSGNFKNSCKVLKDLFLNEKGFFHKFLIFKLIY